MKFIKIMRTLYLSVFALLMGIATYAQESATATTVQTDITTMTTYSGTASAGGGIVGVNGHNVEGNRLLFKDWVKGTVLTSNNATFSPNYVYNYDLMTSQLLIKPLDAVSVLVVDRTFTKSFNLENEGKSFYFEKMPDFETKGQEQYYQVIGRGQKYALYKANKVKLQKADPHDRSQYVRGVIYDEYIPEDYYYAVMPDKSVHPFKMNKRNLYKAFPAEQSKIESYVSAHSDDKMDDVFLAGLMNSLNE